MTYQEVSPLAWVPRLGTLQELPAERAALVRGLFELAAWLCDHPEVPLPTVSATVPAGYHGGPVVDQVRRSLGGRGAVRADRRRYAVDATFGPVRLKCLAWLPRSLDWSVRLEECGRPGSVAADGEVA